MKIQSFSSFTLIAALLCSAVFAVMPPEKSEGKRNAIRDQRFAFERVKDRFKSVEDAVSIDGIKASFEKRTSNANLKSKLKILIGQQRDAAESDLFNSAALDLNQAVATNGVEFHRRAKESKPYVDDLGRIHVNVDQYYCGIPVIGSMVTMHYDSDHQLTGISGTIDPNVALPSVIPAKTSEDAMIAVLKDLNVKLDPADMQRQFCKPPELVINAGVLAYRLTPKVGGTPDEYFVDANTGEVLASFSRIRYERIQPPSQAGAAQTEHGLRVTGEDGTDVTFQGFGITNSNFLAYSFQNKWGICDHHGLHYNELSGGTWFANATANWAAANRPVVSLARNIQIVQAYCLSSLNRDSYNGQGKVVQLSYPAQISYWDASGHIAWTPNNAAWSIADEVIYIGNGDGINHAEFVALDVVAHEFGHAITLYTSDLGLGHGNEECDALNESYSDIFATQVEFANQVTGTGAGQADWTIMEDVGIPRGTYDRNLANPADRGYPTKYLGTNWNPQGEAHYNSTPQSFAFYLLSVGAAANKNNDGITYGPITALGRDNAFHVAMDANMLQHSGGMVSTYAQSRNDWLNAARLRNLDWIAVGQAWAAIGVGSYKEVSNKTITNTQTYTADVIQIGRPGSTTTFETTAKVTAHGVNAIALRSEFRSKPGSYFRAYLN